MEREPPATLAATLDPHRMRPVLEELMRAHQGEALRLAAVDVDSVHRRVIRYVLHLEGPGAGAAPAVVIGKVYETPEAGRHGFTALDRLRRSGFGRDADDGIHVPEVFAFLESEQMVLMEAVPATDLRTQIRARTTVSATWELFARATAKLHRCPLDLGSPFEVRDYLAQREPMPPEVVAEAHPDLAPAVEAVLARAGAWHASLPSSALGSCHGDYHLGQPHVDGRHLWLLDLDRLHRGDPMADLAMIFINLRRLERDPAQASTLRGLLCAFLTTYFASGDWTAAGRIPLYVALIHLKKALKHHRWRREVDWRDRLRQQVQNAGASLDLGADERGPRPPPTGLADVLDLYARCPVKG